ncbi:MAG: aromatic amino acid ammonia-lyase [Bacteroidales bacterium]
MITIKAKESLSIQAAEAIILNSEPFELDAGSLTKVEEGLNFLLDFSVEKIIYGINTGFGPMAQYKIDKDKQVELQYNLIRSHSAGAGEKIPDLYVKASMLVRMLSIMQGKSGIHPSCVTLLQSLILKDVFPLIPEHGGVGASGDLVQLSHMALILIGEGEVTYQGILRPTAEVFNELGLKPIRVVLREGLSLINGTSVMTGIGIINVIKAKQLLDWSLVASAMINEIVNSFDDHFAQELNQVKKHRGQAYIARTMEQILSTSKMIHRREEYFYNNNEEARIFKRRVQEYYSLRCIPQILGAVYDTIQYAEDVVVNEMNSVSDNPIVDVENRNVFHGGNFHGDYVSLEMDKLKIAVTRVSMLSERHLAFLCNPKQNELLPPFINLGKLGLNLGMQGVQFTSTSTVAENQALSNPLYVHSIPTNNDNQDMVSMGTNSALIAKRVIDNAYQVQAIEMIALLQAVDFLKAGNRLSDTTRRYYGKLRELVPMFIEDSPMHKDIEKVKSFLFNTRVDLPGREKV